MDRVKAKFTILEHSKVPGEEGIGEIETLIFESSCFGKIKLAFVTRPVVLDKKIIGAHRRGASKAQYEYVYSETDKTHRLEAYREVDGEWQELDSNALANV